MPMPDEKNMERSQGLQRIKLTARVSIDAYNAITDIQRVHRTKTGHALPAWKVIDAALIAYAKEHHIKTRP